MLCCRRKSQASPTPLLKLAIALHGTQMHDRLGSLYMLADRRMVQKSYIKLLFHVLHMTQIMALSPLVPELNSWCDVQETRV
jgi:hypothetical protein